MSDDDGFELNFLTFDTKVDNFTVDHLIGEGGFGQIYDVVEIGTNKHFAMKIEYLDSRKTGLKIESRILQNLQESDYFPKFITYGSTASFRYLVMELLGPSITTVRHTLQKQAFSKYSLLHLGLHMIRCIEALHDSGYIHRDIKPGNFLIRANRQKPLVLIDFGLSRSYRCKDTGQHKEPRSDPGYTGTVRYASLHAHNAEELSRRDDLISWFYSMIEMSESSTPWPGNENKKLARRLKRSFTKEQLCANFPPEFREIYDIIFNLSYEQKPNYARIENLIQQSIKNADFDYHRYEWETFSKNLILSISPISLNMGDPSDIPKREKEILEIMRQKEVQQNLENPKSSKKKSKAKKEVEEPDGCTACTIC